MVERTAKARTTDGETKREEDQDEEKPGWEKKGHLILICSSGKIRSLPTIEAERPKIDAKFQHGGGKCRLSVGARAHSDARLTYKGCRRTMVEIPSADGGRNDGRPQPA